MEQGKKKITALKIQLLEQYSGMSKKVEIV